jgi:flagellar motor switch protein FliN
MPSINDRADPVLAPVALHAAQKTENTIRYVLIQFLRLLPMFMSGSMGVVLGSTMMPVSNLLKIGRGAVITLDRRVGEPVDVAVNGRTIARGELVVIEDENSRFGISLTEIIRHSRTLG